MKKWTLRAAAAVLLVAIAALTFVWFEAEKEVRILCGQFVPGTSLEDVIRQLDTGNLLHYQVQDDTTRIDVGSRYHATAHCLIELDTRQVTARVYRK